MGDYLLFVRLWGRFVRVCVGGEICFEGVHRCLENECTA